MNHARQRGQVLYWVKHILVVDDDPLVRISITILLAEFDGRLFPAENIQQANAVLAEIALDVVLLDWDLPNGQGRHFFEELKLPVVLLVTTPMRVPRSRCAVLLKPFSQGDLMAAITQSMSEKSEPSSRQ